ncbi:MAG TPA: HNH endonuclease signature motif containing protein [Acidimicrobiales bacterium]|nr:HNH endonuclease signature motif containing protein [Acidimicrobiales bacterium]
MASLDIARQATGLLQRVLAAAVPEDLSGDDAAALAEAFAAAERVAAAGKALYAARVKATDGHRAAGCRDAASWLAGISGDPVGRARAILDTTDALLGSPAARDALVDGELSSAQAQVIGSAAAVDPSCGPDLVDLARRASYRELRDGASRAKRRARSEADEVARERRVHQRRYCRITEPDAGGLRIDAWVTKADGARLLARLQADADALFKEAWAAGRQEPRERHLADALVGLADAGGAGGNRPVPHVVVRVDAAALRRGAVAGDEVCEIPGVGPVPVATARAALGDGFFTLLVTDGADIRTVTSTTRTVPRRLRVALAERDRCCVVPGCSVADHLDIDHWRVDFAKGGLTCLDNLARLCGPHHALKTNAGWRLAGGPGRWRWVPPTRGGGPTRPGRPTRSGTARS